MPFDTPNNKFSHKYIYNLSLILFTQLLTSFPESICCKMDILDSAVIKILLQDFLFLREWKRISDSLRIPNQDLFQLTSRFDNGTLGMYEVIREIFLAWKGRNGGEATTENLIKVLQAENLINAAELLSNHLRSVTAGNGGNSVEIPSPSPSAESEGMQQRNLVVLQRIDFGSYSEVIKVRCIFDNRLYAIKRINIGDFLKLTPVPNGGEREYFQKLIREVLVMAKLQDQLNHPNIVSYQEAWFEGPHQKIFAEYLKNPDSIPTANPQGNPIAVGQPGNADWNTNMFIKMELMDMNLDQWLLQNTRTFETTKTILKQALTGLAFMHEQKIMHRDLKPNNILLNIRQGGLVVKIADFGLSREFREADTTLTTKVGAKSFRSPEMERGDPDYDLKTDIFSLGLICVIMLHPFESQKKMERTLDDMRRGNLDLIDQLEQTYGQTLSLLKSMLHRRAENRPSACQALALI